jgi:hypothetical protein
MWQLISIKCVKKVIVGNKLHSTNLSGASFQASLPPGFIAFYPVNYELRAITYELVPVVPYYELAPVVPNIPGPKINQGGLKFFE